MKRLAIVLALTIAGLTACSSGTTPAPQPAPFTVPSAPTLSVGFGVKQLQFAWTASTGATTYRLMQNPDGVSGFTQLGNDLTDATTGATLDVVVYRFNFATARYALDACNNLGCTRSNEVGTAAGAVQAIGYFKASNTGNFDDFGGTVAISSDGRTLAVAAPVEASGATGVNGNQFDNSRNGSGAVYIFTRTSGTWSQQAYIKASNTENDDQFGIAIALSGDGNKLAVGAYIEDSAATGIGGNQADNSATSAGAVYVFVRSGSAWSQQAYVKASNTEANDQFGWSVALSSDGNTLAVGAHMEASNATGVNGNQGDNSLPGAGAVYVFTRDAGLWSQQAYVKASNTRVQIRFGASVSLSADGNEMAVGASGEPSGSIGINGDQNFITAPGAGAVYIFERNVATWSQEAYIKASNTGSNDLFGVSVSLSGDGSTLAVGANDEDSAATGVNGNQLDNSATSAGAVYVFVRSAGAWSQQSYLKASNTETGDFFGDNIALSGDGNSVAVSCQLEDSSSVGVGGSQSDNSASQSGAVYLFVRIGGVWSQQAYIKASNTEAADGFGVSVTISGDGLTLAVGATGEDSSATGINGNQTSNAALFSGAVYIY